VIHDPERVRAEYASEAGLVARVSVYEGVAGPDAREIALEAVAAATPLRVLEVGCGWGAFAVRIAEAASAEVVALDVSPRMVTLARERGVDARVGDVQALPFEDSAFDCVVANWMLYHVPDLDRALSEIARVLRPGGRLVAATNGIDHLAELWSLVGRDRRAEDAHFFSEDAETRLRRHFERVERRDVCSEITFDTHAARGYISSSIAHAHLAEQMPGLDEPLVATRRNTVFVAEKDG
jgi:SAM-dependent methyltransferase